MLQSIRLARWPLRRHPFGATSALLAVLRAAKLWRRRQPVALGDWAVLRSMSDRELADLAIGRGEFTRDAGPGPRG